MDRSIVVDTSVLIAAIIEDPSKERLIRQTSGSALIAPLSVHWEVGNAFSAMLKRKRITAVQVRRALTSYEAIPIRFVDIDLADAVSLAGKLSIYAYDAYLITCAISQRCPLLTLDQGLVLAARRAGATIVEEIS